MRPKFLTQPKLLFLILFAIGSLFQGFIFPTPVQAHECGSYGGLLVVADPISGTTKINVSFNGIGGASYEIRVYRNFGDNQNDEIYGPDEIEMGDEEVYRTTLDLAASDVNPKGELDKEYHVTVDGGYPGVCGDAAVILGSGTSSTSGECTIRAAFLEYPSTYGFEEGIKPGAPVSVTIEGNALDKFKVWLEDKFGKRVRGPRDTVIPDGKPYVIEEFVLPSNPGDYKFKATNTSKNGIPCAPIGGLEFTIPRTDTTGPDTRLPTNFSILNIDQIIKYGSIGEIITALVPTIYALAGMIALLFLIWGGIRYMTARGDPKAIDAARSTITSAIIGLLVVLLVGVIYAVIAAVFKIQIFGLVPTAFAADCDATSNDIGCILKLGETPISQAFPTIGSLFTAVVRFALAAAALIFFFMLIWGGFRYINAGGDPKNADAARSTLTNAGIGLLIVVVSFVIIEVATRLIGISIF